MFSILTSIVVPMFIIPCFRLSILTWKSTKVNTLVACIDYNFELRKNLYVIFWLNQY